MKKIYKIIIPILILNPVIFAEYTLKFGIEKSNIKFLKKTETELPPKPIYGEWYNFEEPYECSTWIPLRSTITNGINFSQTSECNQKQKRSVSNIPNIYEENKVISINITRVNTGTLECPTFNISSNAFISYGSPTNTTGVIEVPNNGTRIAWNGVLIYSTLNQIKKEPLDEIVLNGYKYKKNLSYPIRNITFEGYNYKSYDRSICRHILEE